MAHYPLNILFTLRLKDVNHSWSKVTIFHLGIYTHGQKKRKWGIGVVLMRLISFIMPSVIFFVFFMRNIDFWTLPEKILACQI